MNILVTGGFGYIGSRLVPELARNGHRVEIAARRIPHFFVEFASEYGFRTWDLREPWSGSLAGHYDLVVHLAAANDIDCANPVNALEVNALGTRNALEFCRAHSVKWFLYVSTFQVYGVWNGTIDDHSEPAPVNDYGVTHWFAEEYVRMYERIGGPDYVVLRPTNIYGAPAHRDIDRWSLVPNCFCREAAETGAITLRSSGRQHRDFVSLATLTARAASVIARLDAHRNKTYVVGCGTSTTIREIANLVARRYEAHFGRACKLHVLSDEPHEAQPLRVMSERSAAAGLLALSAEPMGDEVDRIFDLLKGN